MATQLLRLKRTDKSGQHLLLHVSQTGSSLNLKLIGTEHEHLYHANIKESNAKALQASNYSGDLKEWKEILKYALLHERPDGPLPDSLQGVEAVAAISGKIITVTLRKNIGGITQRLGSVKLDQDDEREEVSPFDWVDTAVANSDTIRTQLESLQASVSGQKDEVEKLSKQLDDLVQAKKEHENELLSKFAALLNAKKLKIRDQQRLLAGAKVDAEAAEAVSDARGTKSKSKAGSSRNGKRKTAEVAEDSDDDMNVIEEEYEEERQDETPARSDDEATEDDSDGGEAFAKPVQAMHGKGKVAMNPPDSSKMDVDDPGELPPRRELPFGKIGGKAWQTKTTEPERQPEPAAAGDGDDDETDDEL